MIFLQVVANGLLIGAVYALFSSGLTLIWGMMNFINFAHGEFVMLGMYAALLVVLWAGGGPAVFGAAAALVLFVLGVLIYLALIKQVMRGPMLAQILSTFGLALLLRYAAVWVFSPNFVTLPPTALAGTVNLGGILLSVAQLVSGFVAGALTLGMHLLLTRTAIGSQLLAVAEDRHAAMLMGIRPDRMQALAWGLSAASAGIAGALMAISFSFSPEVGGTFAIKNAEVSMAMLDDKLSAIERSGAEVVRSRLPAWVAFCTSLISLISNARSCRRRAISWSSALSAMASIRAFCATCHSSQIASAPTCLKRDSAAATRGP